MVPVLRELPISGLEGEEQAPIFLFFNIFITGD